MEETTQTKNSPVFSNTVLCTAFFELFNEDALETMARMQNDSVDLVVTSPPYDGIRLYNGYSFDFENIAKELFRVLKQGGVIVWIVGDATVNGSESGTSFKQALYFKEIGFNLYDTMIYKKINPIPLNHKRYEQSFEFMFVLSKGIIKTFNPIKEPCIHAGIEKSKKRTFYHNSSSNTTMGNRNTKTNDLKIKQNIFEYSVGRNKYKHPAPFPEDLANDHIISWSNEGDLVYDPFAGSGTTGKMAILNNRKCVMSEISKEYCHIIDRRLSNLSYQSGLF